MLSGSIVGQVVDTSGAGVPGASVRLTHRETNQSARRSPAPRASIRSRVCRAALTTSSISKDGFQTFKADAVPLTVGQVARIDAALRVGQISETISVTGEAAALQTDRAEVRSEVTAKQLENLPTPLGRNYENLLITVPGTLAAGQQSLGRRESVARPQLQRDGHDPQFEQRPHRGRDREQHLAAARQRLRARPRGDRGGLRRDRQLRRRPRTLRRLGGQRRRSRAGRTTSTAPPSSTTPTTRSRPIRIFLPAGQRKPKAINNQFGGTFGGPIRKDKLFYFVSYEGSYDRQTGSTILTVPTAAIRAGDMSGFGQRRSTIPLTGSRRRQRPHAVRRTSACRRPAWTRSRSRSCRTCRCRTSPG